MTRLLNAARFRSAVFAVCLAAVMVAGCHRRREVTPPETYPVHGTVSRATGQIPNGYRIEFMPEDPECTASGSIASDGTFTVTTRYLGVVCDGAAAGEYRVSLVPPLALSNRGAPTMTLPRPIRIEPKDNDLTIPLPVR